MRHASPRRAFTLIELLVVVGIIAILAAIAIPNFLEAQTRAKVSRAMSDMRSLRTAMEAYRVDGNSYPNYFERPGWMGTASAGIGLSTPIAYITSAQIRDPFVHGGTLAVTGQEFLMIVTGTRGSADRTAALADQWPKDCYGLASYGPDQIDNTRMVGWPFSYPANSVDANGVTISMWAAEYDPTNGTVSAGDIYMAQPSLPYVWAQPPTGGSTSTGDAWIPAGRDPFQL